MRQKNKPLKKAAAGRPRNFDRKLALETAMNLFWRYGFDGTSTALLTEEMGISPPSLYAAFGSKELLYKEALTSYVTNYGLFLSEGLVITKDISARMAIENVLLEAAKQFSDKKSHASGCMVSIGSLQASPENQNIIKIVEKYRSSARETIHNFLDEAKAQKELPSQTDTLILATYFAAIIQGMAIQAIDGMSFTVLKGMALIAMQSWPGEK